MFNGMTRIGNPLIENSCLSTEQTIQYFYTDINFFNWHFSSLKSEVTTGVRHKQVELFFITFNLIIFIISYDWSNFYNEIFIRIKKNRNRINYYNDTGIISKILS